MLFQSIQSTEVSIFLWLAHVIKLTDILAGMVVVHVFIPSAREAEAGTSHL